MLLSLSVVNPLFSLSDNFASLVKAARPCADVRPRIIGGNVSGKLRSVGHRPSNGPIRVKPTGVGKLVLTVVSHVADPHGPSVPDTTNDRWVSVIALSGLGLPPPVPLPLTYHVDRIGVGDFSKEEESGTKSHKHNEHCEGMEPRRHMRIKVKGCAHKESTGEKGDARNLPIEVMVVKPEGAPAFKAKT